MKYNIDYHTTYSNADYCGINCRMMLFYDYHTMQFVRELGKKERIDKII